VPSIWWENAPLVIAEAFRHGRPVICSNIGGMAEAVRDGVDGLWFRAGDPAHLAERMEEAMSADLWNRLVAGIHPSRSLAEAADDHAAFYARLVDERAATMSEPASVKAAPTASRRRSRRRTAA
jgi:glycosyltransferase involved in cell wall biosynthesis